MADALSLLQGWAAVASPPSRNYAWAVACDEGLGEGQTGLLFVGAAHRVETKLPHDIVVRRIGN